MVEKQITTNELAEMIKNGFDSVEKRMATKEDVKNLDTRLSNVEKDVKYIKENVEGARKLEQRVDYMENILNIQPIKK